MNTTPDLSHTTKQEIIAPSLDEPRHRNGHTSTSPRKEKGALSSWKGYLISFLLIAGFAGVWYVGGRNSAPALQAAPPPYPVEVQTVAEKKIRIWSEYSGRLRAVDFAEIRPEVSGRITQVCFQDGQSVKAGDVLFVIDPRPFEDAVAKTEAKIKSAQASIDFSKSEQTRAATLVAARVIAQRDFDQATSASKVDTSSLEADEAELKAAQLDLEHAYVKAPISGRASRAEITVGNLVESGSSAPLLTSIASQDGIYADFEVDEQTYMETIRNTASGNAQEQTIPVELHVPGDRGHVYNGFIESFDNRIDSTSGTIRARARFANEDGALVPGMFVSVRLASSKESDALIVPERAIGSDQNKKFVYVVTKEGKVAYREITLGKSIDEGRIVEQGLQPGDRVIVDGVQHVRPDDIVQAKEVSAAVAQNK